MAQTDSDARMCFSTDTVGSESDDECMGMPILDPEGTLDEEDKETLGDEAAVDWSTFPRPVNFDSEVADYLDGMPSLARPIRIAMPCIGIDGCGRALELGQVPYGACNVFDLEDGYRKHLQHHFEDSVGEPPVLHLGKVEGDILQCALQDLEGNVDMLVAGCPCPPWAGNGCKQGVDDPRFAVFRTVISWIFWFACHHGLMGVCLENVKGTMHRISGQAAFYPQLQRMFEDNLAMFRWRIDVMDAQSYKSCARRRRVLLRGMHVKFIADEVPAPMPPMGAVDLGSMLGDFPNTDIGSMTTGMQQNIRDYDKYVSMQVRCGKIESQAIVIVAADRAIGKIYKQRVAVNHAPCLTTHNRYLFILRASEVELPYELRTLHRYVHPAERLLWQGFDAERTYMDLGHSKSRFAAGNCYPVGIMLAALLPMARAIACSSTDFMNWHGLGCGHGIGADFAQLQENADIVFQSRIHKSYSSTVAFSRQHGIGVKPGNCFAHIRYTLACYCAVIVVCSHCRSLGALQYRRSHCELCVPSV